MNALALEGSGAAVSGVNWSLRTDATLPTGALPFHATDVDDWERALERLIVSPELRASFGAKGRAHVEERYALRSYRANYLTLLARIAARTSPPSR